MKMDLNIRVRVSKEYDQVYNSLSKGLGIEAHTIFFSCFCLAISKSLSSKSVTGKVEKFWSKTFTHQEWTAIYAAILDKNDMNLKSIENDEDVMRVVEGYANAGMAELLNTLPDEFIRKHNDVLTIAVDDKGEVIKTLLFNLLEIYYNNENEK